MLVLRNRKIVKNGFSKLLSGQISRRLPDKLMLSNLKTKIHRRYIVSKLSLRLT